jgi:putative membrane protein
MMWGFGGLGVLWMVLFWVGLIVLVVWAFRQTGEARTPSSSKNRASEILEERYARGDIDSDEFQARRTELERA